MVLFWHGHRALLRLTHGRWGLWRPRPGRWGALWLTTTGRRTRRPRQVVVGYFEDGRNLVTMAMNGWGAAEPAWWLNLQDHPDAIAQTRDGPRVVRAHRARGEERDRLWSRWAEIDDNWTPTAPCDQPKPPWSYSSQATPPGPALDPVVVVTPRVSSATVEVVAEGVEGALSQVR